MDLFAKIFLLPKETTWYCLGEGQKIGSTDCHSSPWTSGSPICPQLMLSESCSWTGVEVLTSL